MIIKEKILNAAEILLRENENIDFSMRELAKKAEVSFATPFNYFGDKNSILQELSSRLINEMKNCFDKKDKHNDSISNLMTMGEIAVEVLLKNPILNKFIIGSLNIPRKESLNIKEDSEHLWKAALENTDELKGGDRLKKELSSQIALCFRGNITFWCTGDIKDEELKDSFLKGISFLYYGITH
ncbi:hypothetical protein Sdiek2_0847 [Sulfurospirillum diekertiae]|nr:hypothetical protein Sdiek2_0847 [Sulfurospirillum diekertiae]